MKQETPSEGTRNAKLWRGHDRVRHALPSMPESPGVYRFLDDAEKVLYVGKARSLKKRLASYARKTGHSQRIARMIYRIREIDIVTTRTENEALLLESNLIKKLRPPYNILLRDDKSFPYILIREDHPSPLLTLHRGAQTHQGSYYGPFATSTAVRTTIDALEKTFLLRTCSDSVFAHRTRPCLLYQIKRCSAPCVGKIDAKAYGELVQEAKKFLSGRSGEVQKKLATAMQSASDEQEYEKAAVYRDRLRAMARILASQDINIENLGDADVFVCCRRGNDSCIHVVFFRGGCHYGDRSYFPRHADQEDCTDILAALLPQFYQERKVPRRIYLSDTPSQDQWLSDALSLKAGYRVTLTVPRRGRGVRALRHARDNAQRALAQKAERPAARQAVMDELVRLLDLPKTPERIEVYDNSHTGGQWPLGVMIVWIGSNPQGFASSHYRRFHARQAAGDDDYAILREVLQRRFSAPARHGSMPDMILIDGGKGQLRVALDVLASLHNEGIRVVAIAKGENRHRSIETLYTDTGKTLHLNERDGVLHFLQRLRDEAHRFAIGSHRQRRGSSLSRSRLDDIDGIGTARKRSLLRHFGSAADVANAGMEDLRKAPGIAESVARKIHAHFHPATHHDG